jgi:hypothetical protein
MEQELDKTTLFESIENLMEFDGLCQITGLGISVKGTLIDFIILDGNGMIKFYAGDDPTDEDGEYEEVILSIDEQNRVLKEFNELI